MFTGRRLGGSTVFAVVAGLAVGTACGSSNDNGSAQDAGAVADAESTISTPNGDGAAGPGDAESSATPDAEGGGTDGSSTDGGSIDGSIDGGSSDGGPDGSSARCALGASCAAADKTCVGLASNAGATKFGLRMSQIHYTAPAAFASGLLATTIAGSAGLNQAACNQEGSGTFSWLLQFDTAAGTLKTGGAKPVSDPTNGYSFDDEMLQSFHVQPATFTNVMPAANGSFSVTAGMDLVMPIFLNSAGTSVMLLPMHQARITSGTLSSSNDCIGSYNAAGLDPANSCQPDSTHPGFLDGGELDGFISLENADQVVIAAINQTLCVALSGDATTYGMASAGGITVCKRDASNKILYQGTWCATTNAAATASCADADEVSASFAAGSVQILN